MTACGKWRRNVDIDQTTNDGRIAEERFERRLVERKRKRAEKTYGPLAQTVMEAIRIFNADKADGVPPDECHARMERTLRAAWPQTRAWKYYCDACSDTGWLARTCFNRSCGRPFKLPGQRSDDYTGQGRCTEGHEYVQPCSCAKGDERRRSLTRQPTQDDEITRAGRSSKPTRFGQRS